MIRACIFDLDGTLLDSEKLWAESLDEFLRGRGAVLPWKEVVAIVYGKSWHDIYADVRRRVPALDMALDPMQRILAESYLRRRSGRDVRIPGSISLLRRIAAGRTVCIVSGSARADIAEAISHMGIEKDIAFYLGSEDYSPGKPDPACFLMAARRLGCAPAECFVFEDSAAGVRAARSAGMRCAALARPDGVPQDLSGAEIVLQDLAGFDEKTMLDAG
jgi:HAD superfamily hydrolase (TIGR01509 family)